MAVSVSTEAAKVLGELSFAVAQGMHDAMMADPLRRRYVLDPKARDYWLEGHAKSVPRTLKTRGRVWENDRTGVLLMATLLGFTAASLAYAAAGNTPGLVRVKLANAKKATKIVRGDKRCVAFSRLGGGRYCEF